MQIERLTAGEYAVTHGEKLVSLKRGLDRKWKVEPIVPGGESRTVKSYGDAKQVAASMITGEAAPAPGTQARPKRAARAERQADPVERAALGLKLLDALDAAGVAIKSH